ncbi:hypothetical protein CALVIDRAFT_437750 [Calocera viscosa TUFC12733]|uniref:Uncharacterized protein n=1 Tax=Calocera viscosa (strain TUFC12733) TaxID=1330018 RepID=A0A167FTC1_CALVF|nr:hypothetical protein CALVIDRAFT_437750 [Calocera viscosa TUFC12733]
MTFTGCRHDAGGRYRFFQGLLGERWWYYFRPNAATTERLERDPQSVLDDLDSFDLVRMERLGDFYYVPVRAGTWLLQPSWTKYYVWTSEDAFAAGKTFDLPSFARKERCLKEGHVCRTDNATASAWYSSLAGFGTAIPCINVDRLMLPDDDLYALHRMVLNPRAYVAEHEQGADGQELDLALVVEEVHRIRSDPEGDARELSLKKVRRYRQCETGAPVELHDLHRLRVQLLAAAIPALEGLFAKRGLPVPNVAMVLYGEQA